MHTDSGQEKKDDFSKRRIFESIQISSSDNNHHKLSYRADANTNISQSIRCTFISERLKESRQYERLMWTNNCDSLTKVAQTDKKEEFVYGKIPTIYAA